MSPRMYALAIALFRASHAADIAAGMPPAEADARLADHLAELARWQEAR